MQYIIASPEEKKLGLELFFTNSPGIKGRVKKEPEDFNVTERSLTFEPTSEDVLINRHESLPVYTYATVRSKNWETNRLLQKLSEQLSISYDKVFFAGSKDKRAVTTQLMAFQAPMEDVQAVHIEGVELSNLFTSTRVLKIGDLIGNDFKITISNIKIKQELVKQYIDATWDQLKTIKGFPNFFGVQRFGIIRPITHQVGKLLVKKHFEDAILMYIGYPIKNEPISDYEARSEFSSYWDFDWAMNNYPKHLVFERVLIKYLIERPDDYAGALTQFPKNLATMFIHAYQSLLFNKILCTRIRQGLPLLEPILGDIVLPVDSNNLPIHKTWIPVNEGNIKKLTKQCKKGKAFVSAVLFGCETDFAQGEMGEIERKIIEKEGIESKDFIIPELPQISSKGSRREVVAPVFDFKYEILKASVKMQFGLYKGAYATTLLREFMKSKIRNY